MKSINLLAVLSFLMVAGCVTYPYQTAFDTCDAEAGACYRYCEEVSDNEGEYAACHADCEVGANRCFADAYDRYSYSGYSNSRYSAPSWPWYGRYGAWGPSSGYYFDFTYWGGYSSRHPYYRDPYYGGHGRGRGKGDHRRNRDKDRPRKGGDRGEPYAPPPGSPAANNPRRPRQMPGERDYGAEPNQRERHRTPPRQPSQESAAPQPRATPRAPAPSAPAQSSPRQSSPPASSQPRQRPSSRSTPRQRHKSGNSRNSERPKDY